MRASLLILAAVLLAACSNLTEMPGTPAFNVAVSASRNDSTGTITLQINNKGSSTAYFIPCGSAPYATISKFESGRWLPTSGVACPLILTTGPLALSPNGSLVLLNYLPNPGPGLFRVEVSVSEQTTLDGARIASSNSIEIR